jgi:hypothetical protein
MKTVLDIAIAVAVLTVAAAFCTLSKNKSLRKWSGDIVALGCTFLAIALFAGVINVLVNPSGPSPQQLRSEVSSVARYANTLAKPTSSSMALADAREARHLANDAFKFTITVSPTSSTSSVPAWSFNVNVQRTRHPGCLTFDRETQLWTATTRSCSK